MTAIKRNKIPILVGLIFSLALSFIILRGMLFSAGLTGYGDLAFNFDISTRQAGLAHSWNQLISSHNAQAIFLLPIDALSYLFNDAGTFVKFVYFLVFTLIGSISFYTAFFYLRGRVSRPLLAYLGAITAALVYTGNPFTIRNFVHHQGLFAYAFLPLIFYFVPIAMRQVTFKGVLKYAIILSLILMLTTTWYVMFFVAAFLMLFFGFAEFISRVITERRRLRTYIPYNLLLAALIVCLFGFLFAYYLLPFRVAWSPSVAELRLFISNPADLIMWTGATELDDTFRMFANDLEISTLFDYSGNFEQIWIICTWVVPILALSAIILKPRNKEVIVLAILAMIGMFMSKGAGEPFGDWNLWLFFKFDEPFSAAGLHDPQRARGLLTLSYAILCAIGVTAILGRIGRRGPWRGNLLPIIPWVGACSLICISAFPILSGDLRGCAKPWEMPQPYRQMNQWLEGQEGIYEVIWLPGVGAVEWNPLIGSAETKFAGATSKISYFPYRLLSKEAGNLTGRRCLEGQMYERYVSSSLTSDQQTSYIGRLLSAENCKYIVYHDDTYEELFQNYRLEDLYLQEDLSEVYVVDYVHIFENKAYLPYLHTQDKGILVVGGLDALGLLVEQDLPVPGERSFIFLEQNLSRVASFEQQLQFTDFILFYGNKDFDDLTLSSLDHRYYLPALEYWGDDYHSPWERAFVSSSRWSGVLPSHQGAAFDFDLNLGATYTEEPGAELDFTLNTDDDYYELWIRNLLSAEGGGLEVYVDGSKILEEINSYSEVLQGFKWQEIGQMPLSRGEHEIKIKTKEGWEAINTIAVVPEGTLERHREAIDQWLKNDDIKILYFTDYNLMSKYSEQFPPRRLVELDILEEQEYVVAVLGEGWFTLEIDSTESYRFITEDVEWGYSDPLTLSQGEHQIVVAGRGVQDIVIYPVDGGSQTLAQVLGTEVGAKVISNEIVDPLLQMRRVIDFPRWC